MLSKVFDKSSAIGDVHGEIGIEDRGIVKVSGDAIELAGAGASAL